ncbi:OST-HTH/LOTUS and NYN domain protein [Metarhizium robertsii]|uniref:OST-HTH/LOTUS and NYN domain protein n=1 Tax=Metarhizium robertsii TaxID=568076 RepID=A0A014N529_9HYPO|nr:OST-HTH/LOTUS and NYN domain protein [Metarhizium robertsii]
MVHDISTVKLAVAKYGTAFVKRAYGDWTGTQLNGWKHHLLENSIRPMQQFACTKGKNATDAALVIDAMDLLYSEQFGFVLFLATAASRDWPPEFVSSGLLVYGCGERKTPKPFVTACDKFIYIEKLTAKTDLVKQVDTMQLSEGTGHSESPKSATEYLRSVVEVTSDDNGWASLSNVGGLTVKRLPDFDARTYGYAKLSELIRSLDAFELCSSHIEGKQAVLYVREKKRYD